MMRLITLFRAVIVSVFNLISTLMFSIVVMIFGFMNQQEIATMLIRGWAQTLLWSFGIHVDVAGEENLPATGGGIITFNHQSHLDIPSVVVATKKQIRFGAKIELFNIPFFGPAIGSVGTLKIARDKRAEVLKIYEEASKRFKQNILFVLAPEGTRQKEPRLGRFKKGPFIFAMNAKVPVIPVVLKGAFNVLPPHKVLVNLGKWRSTIYVRFLPPIESTSYTSETLETFVNDTFEKMNSVYESLPSAKT